MSLPPGVFLALRDPDDGRFYPSVIPVQSYAPPVSARVWLDTSTEPATFKAYNGTAWDVIGTQGPQGDPGAAIAALASGSTVLADRAIGTDGSTVALGNGSSTFTNLPDGNRFPTYAGGDARWQRNVGVVAVKSYGTDTTAVQAALTAGAGKTVVFEPGVTYAMNAQLNVSSGTTVVGNGATLDFSTMPAGAALGQKIGIKATGTLGSPKAIGTAITAGSRTVAGISSTTGLVAGEMVLISNDERPLPGMTRTDRDKGELNIIASVDSSSQVTLETDVQFAYATTGLTIAKVTPVERVTIDGLRLVMGGVGSAHNGIEIQYGREARIRGVHVDGAEDTGLTLRTVWNGRIENCHVRRATSPSLLGNTGYGVQLMEASRFVTVSGCDFFDCRHFVAGGGIWPTIDVTVEDCSGVKASQAGFDCHEPTWRWAYRRCTSVASAAEGFLIRGQYPTVEDCTVLDCAGSGIKVWTFDGVTEQRGVRIVGNRIVSGPGIAVDGRVHGAEPTSLKHDVQVVGNHVTGASFEAIFVGHFNGALVADNVVPSPGTRGIYLLGISGTQSVGAVVSGNVVKAAGGNAIEVSFVDDVTVVGGVVSGSAYGVRQTSGDRCIVQAVNATGATTAPKVSVAATTQSVTGNLT